MKHNGFVRALYILFYFLLDMNEFFFLFFKSLWIFLFVDTDIPWFDISHYFKNDTNKMFMNIFVNERFEDVFFLILLKAFKVKIPLCSVFL